jgi:hypothetical protein
MEPHSPDQRLSRISTLWSLVSQAHHGPEHARGTAHHQLMERYGGAAYRYLLGALRDREAADELFQDFSLRFLRGDFRNVNSERGRFRDFLKTSLFHLIVDHQRRQKAQRRPFAAARPEPATEAPILSESEQLFRESWREQLMDRAWVGLEAIERQSGQPHHTVLRFRAEQPLLSSAELAGQLSTRLGKSYTIDGVRQALHRARETFIDLVLDEVARSLERMSRERLEEELAELGLLTYCRAALTRWSQSPGPIGRS